jgi:hypothetical protein
VVGWVVVGFRSVAIGTPCDEEKRVKTAQGQQKRVKTLHQKKYKKPKGNKSE